MVARTLLVVCCSSAVIAQTYVVDAANGPGTNFLDIVSAVAAVPDGAVLEVRAGTYTPFTIANKGLTILGTSGVIISAVTMGWPIVANTSAQQVVELRDLSFANGFVQLTGCQGLVLIANCPFAAGGGSSWLNVTNCAQLAVELCTFGSSNGSNTVRLTNTTAVFEHCSVTSQSVSAMDFTNSSVQLLDCAVGAVGYPAPAAIRTSGGDLRMSGGSVWTYIFGYPISASGTVRLDPSVALLCSPSACGPIPRFDMPAVDASGGSLGTQVTTTLRGPVGDVGALLVGVQGLPLPIRGFADASWMLPGTETVCVFAVLSASVIQVSYPIPNLLAMRGARFTWQGISYGATNGAQLSNPAITAHW